MGWAAALIPNTATPPSIGFSSVVSIRIVVVFPAPFGPSRPNVSPGVISRSSPLTAVCGPNRYVSPAHSTAGLAGAAPAAPPARGITRSAGALTWPPAARPAGAARAPRRPEPAGRPGEGPPAPGRPARRADPGSPPAGPAPPGPP